MIPKKDKDPLEDVKIGQEYKSLAGSACVVTDIIKNKSGYRIFGLSDTGVKFETNENHFRRDWRISGNGDG